MDDAHYWQTPTGLWLSRAQFDQLQQINAEIAKYPATLDPRQSRELTELLNQRQRTLMLGVSIAGTITDPVNYAYTKSYIEQKYGKAAGQWYIDPNDPGVDKGFYDFQLQAINAGYYGPEARQENLALIQRRLSPTDYSYTHSAELLAALQKYGIGADYTKLNDVGGVGVVKEKQDQQRNRVLLLVAAGLALAYALSR